MADEYEKFEITDYDLQNEFSHTRRKGLSKEQQIYGMWAENSDGEVINFTSIKSRLIM